MLERTIPPKSPNSPGSTYAAHLFVVEAVERGQVGMVTEIRPYGDHTQVIVHTDDPVIVRKLHTWKNCQRVQAYECGAWPNLTPIAYDFYFLTDHEQRVARDLQQMGIPISESRAPQKKGGQTALFDTFFGRGVPSFETPDRYHGRARKRQKRGPNGHI